MLTDVCVIQQSEDVKRNSPPKHDQLTQIRYVREYNILRGSETKRDRRVGTENKRKDLPFALCTDPKFAPGPS